MIVRHLDHHRQQISAARLAVGVEVEAVVDAALQRLLQHEIERTKVGQCVARDGPARELAELLLHGVGGDLALDQRVVLGAIGDERHGLRVALVAGAAVREVEQLDLRHSGLDELPSAA